VIVDATDWRLTGQEEHLQKKLLLKRKYAPPRPEWDHDHCAFCWQKFLETKEPDTIQEGYVTEDGKVWICPTCVADFKDDFGWTTEDPAPVKDPTREG
jgi:hypothetical protein